MGARKPKWVNDGRWLMVCDERGYWFVRHVWSTAHDLSEDRKVYTCDYPEDAAHIMSRRHETMQEAIVTLREALQINVPVKRTRRKAKA
jgi:hypothetical protein